VSTRVLAISSSSVSTSTTMRLARTSTCPVRYLSTSSQELWTLFALALLEASSGPTTLSSARAARVTTGRRAVSSSGLYVVRPMLMLVLDYTEGAELVDSVLDVVRKEAEGADALQGTLGLGLQEQRSSDIYS
jgi:hypothetical protein